MPKTPKARDMVKLTRTLPDGRTVIHTGMLTDLFVKDGQLLGGQIGGSYWDFDAGQMLRLYGVVQTLTVDETPPDGRPGARTPAVRPTR